MSRGKVIEFIKSLPPELKDGQLSQAAWFTICEKAGLFANKSTKHYTIAWRVATGQLSVPDAEIELGLGDDDGNDGRYAC